jgi:hypothetical protein
VTVWDESNLSTKQLPCFTNYYLLRKQPIEAMVAWHRARRRMTHKARRVLG